MRARLTRVMLNKVEDSDDGKKTRMRSPDNDVGMQGFVMFDQYLTSI